MDKEYDIIALGEYLIDFTPLNTVQGNNPCFEMNPGGAPANCLAACAALGGKTVLIGAVGNDMFGQFLKEKALNAGINISGIQTVSQSTTLTFVSLDKKGEREFAFIRSPGADTRIEFSRIPLHLLENTKFFHFGSLSLTDEPARSATSSAISYAKSCGAMISYDPNYRPSLWMQEREAVKQMIWGMGQADIVKLSDEELRLLTGKDIKYGVVDIFDMGVKELYITAGSKGAWWFTKTDAGFERGFSIDVIDTTGCGDAFFGAILFLNCIKPNMSYPEKVRFANAVGALCAAKRGGICAMPDLKTTLQFMEQNIR